MSDSDSQLDIRRIYVKDVSFESPQAPRSIDNPNMTPAIDINMGVSYQKLDDGGHHEIVLVITVTAKSDDQVVFLAEVHQAGLFNIQGFSEEDMGLVLNVAGPTVLLPFARAAITDVVSKGGFPQLLINPVNFEVLYRNKQSRDRVQTRPSESTSIN